ncbi:hypothetical protein JTB14_036084 [Gonioctena quinquepunctata]|nr:hypothetical protein JTB14_036084 [Gonioctena quinquepunctata]
MDEMAKKFFHDHKHPLMKLELLGSKLFLKASTEEEAALSDNNQNILENVLRHSRVEKRCARAKAEWCPAINLVRVTKVVKGLLENFGYQDKSGIFMYLEEMLVLVETNRMELTFRGVPLTLQECYEITLKTVNLKRYMIYKKFVLRGYRLMRYEEILRRLLKGKTKPFSKFEQVESSNRTKRHHSQESEDLSKRSKKIKLQNDLKDTDKQLKIKIEDVFERMKRDSPKEYDTSIHPDLCPEYCVFLPTNKSRTDWNFSLFFSDDLLNQATTKEGPTKIYAICSEDHNPLCKLYNVNLPTLEIDLT